MDTIESPVEQPKPKQKRKYVRRKRAVQKPFVKAERKTSDFPGLSATMCPSACKENACVISGKSYCGHPFKGGLQANDMGNSETMARQQQARKQIKMATVEKSYA